MEEKTVRSVVQPWTPGERETVQKAGAVIQDWTVRHKSGKGGNCLGRQSRKKHCLCEVFQSIKDK